MLLLKHFNFVVSDNEVLWCFSTRWPKNDRLRLRSRVRRRRRSRFRANFYHEMLMTSLRWSQKRHRVTNKIIDEVWQLTNIVSIIN